MGTPNIQNCKPVIFTSSTVFNKHTLKKYRYKEPLKDITSLIFKIKGSLSFCDTNEMPFLIKKESVIDEKKPIYETRSEFRGSAVGWINEWIENNKRTLTYEDLKNIADFVPGEQVITTDIFDYPGHIGDARNLVTIGSLLDTSFSDPDRIDKDNFVKIVKTMLKKVKEEHQEQNFIAKFMFFPIFCPKFIKGHKDRLDVIYEYIKDVNKIGLHSFALTEFAFFYIARFRQWRFVK